MSGSHRFAVRALTLAVATTTAGLGSVASASMGNLGTTYGVMPVDVAPVPVHVQRSLRPITTPPT